MRQFSPQFEIINKIKSIVKKTGNLLGATNQGITSAIARKIQRTAYEVSRHKEKDAYTPPYLWIAEELQSKDIQIFKAAVSYLANIAVNEHKYTQEIITILKHNGNSDIIEKDEYIRNKVQWIKNMVQQKKENNL